MLHKPYFLKVIHILCSILAIFLIYASFGILGYQAGVSQNPLYDIPIQVFLWILGFYLALILHELGHAFFGRISGYQTIALGLGKWNIVFLKHGVRYKKKFLTKEAAAQYIGVKKNRETDGDILMFSGGLIVHLTLASCYLLFGMMSQVWTWFLPQIFLNLALFILNIDPNGITDGAKILELALYPQHKVYLYQELDHAAQLFLDNQEAKLADFTQEIPLEAGIIAQTAYLNHTEVQLFHGHLDQAEKQLLTLSQFTEIATIRMMSQALLLLTYLLKEELPKATELAETKDIKKVFQQPQSQVQMIKAYYEIFILQDSAQAQHSLKKARTAFQLSHFLQDEKEYYTQLLDLVQQQIIQCENP
ncbi:hypothetical protein AB1I63_09600 [Streptococcus pneumoniae]